MDLSFLHQDSIVYFKPFFLLIGRPMHAKKKDQNVKKTAANALSECFFCRLQQMTMVVIFMHFLEPINYSE
jgi:hypothetical protein